MRQSFREKICQAYLKKSPIAHALPRIIECFVLRQFDLKSPILDLGCGDGTFSRICLGKGKVDVGLDPDPQAIRLAKKSGAFKRVVVAHGERMPFNDSFFNTVISNSVLEHVKDLDSVFKEVRRVLKRDGRFIFLVPDKTASDYFFYASLLEKIKLKSLADFYVRLKNRLCHYAHLENREFWEKVSRRGGFRIKSVTGFISPETVKVIDFFAPFALPGYLLRRIFDRGFISPETNFFIFRPDFITKIITPRLLRYCGPVKESEATGWCFELEKI